MGMLSAVVGGCIALILGFLGLFFWFKQFLTVLAGTLPVMFIFGGGIALFIGITELKDTLKAKEEETRLDTTTSSEETKSSFAKEEEKN